MSGDEVFSCPLELTLMGDAELAALRDQAVAAFERVHGQDDLTPEILQQATSVADDLDRINEELRVRDVRAELKATAAKDTAAQAMAKLSERVHGPADPAAASQTTGDLEAVAAAAARGVTQGLVAAMGSGRGGNSPADVVRQAASLSASRQFAPDPGVAPAKANLKVITASVDIPKRGVASGGVVVSMEAMADAFIQRASNIPTTAQGQGAARYPVASIQNQFTHTVDERTGPAQIDRLVRELTGGDKQQALLAGGGWCAPSEIYYDLFNISDVPSGIIDLPTVGISRGGIQFPTSPSIKDVFFTAGGSNPATGMGGFAATFANTSDPWLWSETDDINTVTGSINKPTLRVPCASFSNSRLEVYGITLTAGNLTDSAYPEAAQNFLRLLRNAYAHVINARLISLMSAASTVTAALPASATVPAFQGVMNGIELAAVDYRNRFGMSDTAVLEVVLPTWVLAAIRADLTWRTYGDDSTLSVPDSAIIAMFATRGVAVQFVSDWQVRGASQFGQAAAQMTAWPTTVQFMMYAAGTFLHGTGLSLDLGVIRDSILNAENDFTAAWAEEAHLVAKVGHESRLYTLTFMVSGQGVASLATGGQPNL